MINGLKYVKMLEGTGMPSDQSSTLIEILDDHMNKELATKSDLNDAKSELLFQIQSLDSKTEKRFINVERQMMQTDKSITDLGHRMTHFERQITEHVARVEAKIDHRFVEAEIKNDTDHKTLHAKIDMLALQNEASHQSMIDKNEASHQAIIDKNEADHRALEAKIDRLALQNEASHQSMIDKNEASHQAISDKNEADHQALHAKIDRLAIQNEADHRALEAKIDLMTHRLTIRMGGMAAATVSLVVALQKLL